VRPLEPDGDVRTVILGRAQARDFHLEIEIGRERRRSDGAGQPNGDGNAHSFLFQWTKTSSRMMGMTTPSPTIGHVAGRPTACSLRSTNPVTQKTMQASAKTSRKRLHTKPVLRPLWRSLR